jgi:hypothetical protein
MRKLFAFLLLFASAPMFAVTYHAVSVAGAGAKTGADWNNSFAGLPSTLTRGDVYCLADGNYGTHLSLPTAVSGTSTIELRKAQSTVSDSCTALAGWNGSTMGSSQAVWNSPACSPSCGGGFVSISGGYWIINGNGGNASTNEIGCGGVQASPPALNNFSGGGGLLDMRTPAPTPAQCGIKIDDSTCTSTATDGCDGGSGFINGTGNNVTLESVEIEGQGLNPSGTNASEAQGYWCGSGACANFTITKSYLHNASSTYMVTVSGGWTNGLFSYNYVWGLFDAVNHAEAIQLQGTNAGPMNVHHNIFRDQRTNGEVVAVGTGNQSNLNFYDNWDYCDAAFGSCNHTNGVIGCFNNSTNNEICTGYQIYNNTFSFSSACGYNLQSSSSNATVKNNLYYDCSSASAEGGAGTITGDYNSYLNSSQSAIGAHDVSSSSAPNPFVNLGSGNLNLASENADWDNRVSLGSPYDTDINVVAFTSDRGAAQYTSGGASFTVSPVTIPANHSGNITLTLAGSGTSWTGSTAFSISGVTGATLISKSNTSSTAETLVVTTGSGTGTLTVTDTTDSIASTNTVTVATATLALSPTSGAASTTPSLTLTGTNTLWSTETASTLFSVSGGSCSGESLATPTVSSNTAATATLTTGSASCTITVTDNSTTATATFTVATLTLPTVTTGTLTSSTPTTAAINSNSWSCTGSCATVTSEGTRVGTTNPPTTACTSDGTTSPWNSSLTGLAPNALYYFQACATNSVGTAYGSVSSFTTPVISHVPSGSNCSASVTQTETTTNTWTASCSPANPGDAITAFVQCHPTSGTITGITLTASGYTVGGTGLGSINQMVAPASTGSNSWGAAYGIIALNTSPVTFTATFTGASNCTNFSIWNSDEFIANDPTGGTTTFNATGSTSGGASTCNKTAANITPPLNNEAVWNACLLGSATTATSPWTLGETDGNGNSTEYQLLSGGASTAQTPAYSGSSGAYIVEGMAIAPAPLTFGNCTPPNYQGPPNYPCGTTSTVNPGQVTYYFQSNSPQGTVNTSTGAISPCTANCMQWVSGDPFVTTWQTGVGAGNGGNILLGGGVGTVNTSTTSVTWVSGTVFSTSWSGTMTIAGTARTISSCTSATACTLTASAGTLTGAGYSVKGTAYGVSTWNSTTVATLLSAPGTATGVTYMDHTACKPITALDHGSGCQNSVSHDPALPGYVAGSNLITQITDQSVVTNGASIGNCSSSGGDNDRMWSKPNETYFWCANNGAAAQVYQISTALGYAQVVNSSAACPGSVPPGVPSTGFSTGWLSDTRYYYGSGSVVYQGDLSGSGCSLALGTATPVVDFMAAGVCPGVSGSLSIGSIMGVTGDGTTIEDDTFTAALIPGGQGSGDWILSWSRTKGCAAANLHTGQGWAFCTSSCTTSTPALGTMATGATNCWGLDGSTNNGIHNVQSDGRGLYAFISTDDSAGLAEGGCAGATSALIELQIGTLGNVWTGSVTSGGHTVIGNHQAAGIDNIVSNAYPYMAYSPDNNLPGLVIYNDFPNSNGIPIEDMHNGLPTLCTGSYSDNCAFIGNSDTVYSTQLSGCTGSGAFVAAVYCPTALSNMVLVFFPFTAFPAPILSFAHTGSCGGVGNGCADQIPDAFGSLDAIGIPSPHGDMLAFVSSQWHQLGYDKTAAPAEEAFIIYFGQPQLISSPCAVCMLMGEADQPTPTPAATFFPGQTR